MKERGCSWNRYTVVKSNHEFIGENFIITSHRNIYIYIYSNFQSLKLRLNGRYRRGGGAQIAIHLEEIGTHQWKRPLIPNGP